MVISLIVAMSDNRVIGRDGDLPWRLSADLRRFKRLTMGHHIIMGRKTFESIGRLLPGRTSIVISRRQDYDAKGAKLARDLNDAIQLAGDDNEVFVIGGAEIYRLALPRVDRIYMTAVHVAIEGDTYFPEFDARQWRLIEDERHAADEKNQYDYNFRIYERID